MYIGLRVIIACFGESKPPPYNKTGMLSLRQFFFFILFHHHSIKYKSAEKNNLSADIFVLANSTIRTRGKHDKSFYYIFLNQSFTSPFVSAFVMRLRIFSILWSS